VLDAPGRRLPQQAARFPNHFVVNGRLRGAWRQTRHENQIAIELQLFAPLATDESRALDEAVDRHGRFMNMPVSLALVNRRT
jgi:hypothetical protein